MLPTALRYPCGTPPPDGCTREIVPDVLWVRMPMPYALDHINLWALRDGGGWAIVDTGLRTDDTDLAWKTLLAADGTLADGVTRVLATHMHPDHVGMAGWLAEVAGVTLWMTRGEYLTGRALMELRTPALDSAAAQFYGRTGLDDGMIDRLAARVKSYGRLVHPLPDSYQRLRDGDQLTIGGQIWRVIVGAGHSPEHACLYCADKGLLISGDQVLPCISSNVSAYPMEPDADPISEWLASLDKLRQSVPDETLVLPSHNEPFEGLHARLDQLARSQHDALNRLRDALWQPKRSIDVFAELFTRPVGTDAAMLSLAIGESVAHLNYLLHRGEVRRDIHPDGVTWYRRS